MNFSISNLGPLPLDPTASVKLTHGEPLESLFGNLLDQTARPDQPRHDDSLRSRDDEPDLAARDGAERRDADEIDERRADRRDAESADGREDSRRDHDRDDDARHERADRPERDAADERADDTSRESRTDDTAERNDETTDAGDDAAAQGADDERQAAADGEQATDDGRAGETADAGQHSAADAAGQQAAAAAQNGLGSDANGLLINDPQADGRVEAANALDMAANAAATAGEAGTAQLDAVDPEAMSVQLAGLPQGIAIAPDAALPDTEILPELDALPDDIDPVAELRVALNRLLNGQGQSGTGQNGNNANTAAQSHNAATQGASQAPGQTQEGQTADRPAADGRAFALANQASRAMPAQSAAPQAGNVNAMPLDNAMGNQSGSGTVQSTEASSATRASQQAAATAPGRPVPLSTNAGIQVAIQLARAVQDGQDRLSVRLNPPELGRVDIKLDVAQDGRAVAVVTADRQETLDLLRQDARGLERALQEAGLRADSGSLSFNLRHQGQDGERTGGGNERSALGEDPEHQGGGDQDLPRVDSDRVLDISV